MTTLTKLLTTNDMDKLKYEITRLVELDDYKQLKYCYVVIQMHGCLILLKLMKRYHMMRRTLLRKRVYLNSRPDQL